MAATRIGADEIVAADGAGAVEFPDGVTIGGVVVTPGSGGLPYKVYTALLAQTGTNNPAATVLQNTLGGAIVWTRFDFDSIGDAKGQYVGTLTGAFSDSKTFVLITPKNFSASVDGNFSALYLTADTLGIRSYISGTLDDYNGVLYLEIRAYP